MRFVVAGKVRSERPRYAMIRDAVFQHMAHHRGQFNCIPAASTMPRFRRSTGPRRTQGALTTFKLSASAMTKAKDLEKYSPLCTHSLGAAYREEVNVYFGLSSFNAGAASGAWFDWPGRVLSSRRRVVSCHLRARAIARARPEQWIEVQLERGQA